jgi:uncharacterized OB-fold protein
MSVVPDTQEHNEPASRAQLPPSARSRIVAGLTAAAARGRFELQVCQHCGATQYPPREACHQCLSVALEWKLQSGRGELLSQTTLFHSHHEFFRERLPWRLGIIKLDCGAIVIAHLCADVQDAPSRVRVDVRLDKTGQAALVAFPDSSGCDMLNSNLTGTPLSDDRQLRELGRTARDHAPANRCSR